MPKRRQVIVRDSAVMGTGAMEAPITSKPTTEQGYNPLSESSLKDFFNDVFTLADEARKPREMIWHDAWDLYNNQYDWSAKAWWQTKAPIPKVRSSVDKAVALFRKTLLRLDPFYAIQAESRLGIQKGNYTVLLTDYWFDQASAIEALVTAFKAGMITSTSVLKIWWQTVREFKPEMEISSVDIPVTEFGVETGIRTEERRDMKFKPSTVGKLGIAPVDPFNCWVVPGTGKRMRIERTVTTLDEIMALSEGDKPVYIPEAADRLKQRSATKIEEVREARRKGEAPPRSSDFIRQVELFHFWGDIYDKNGQVALADASFTMADKDILLRNARPTPFFHKQSPLIIGTPYVVPFSTYGRGMVEDVAEIARRITELSCLIMDGAMFDAMKAFAIDLDALDNPAEAKDGVYPGKAFSKRGNTTQPGQKVVETIDVGKVPAEAMSALSMYHGYFSEGTYLNEWVSGQGGKTGRTLGEVNIKTQSALEGLDESARNLEITLIEPMVEMAAKVIYQFHEDYTLPRLMENYPQVSLLLQQMSPAERYATMVGGFSFKTRGLSVMIDQAQQMGEIKEILSLLSYLPGVLEQLNQSELLEKIFAPLGWDIQKLLPMATAGNTATPAPGAQPQMNPQMLMQRLMQAIQQAQQQGGGPRNSMQARNANEGARFGGARNNPGRGR